MSHSTRLLSRLLLAATSTVACSSSTELPASNDTCSSLACAPGDTCSHPAQRTGSDAVGPVASVWCSCGASGKFDCSTSPLAGISTTSVTACYYDGADKPCLAVSDSGLAARLGQHHTTDCPSLVVSQATTGPVAETRSDGTAACCYQVSVGYCAGRPVVVDGGVRVASLVRSATWSA